MASTAGANACRLCVRQQSLPGRRRPNWVVAGSANPNRKESHESQIPIFSVYRLGSSEPSMTRSASARSALTRCVQPGRNIQRRAPTRTRSSTPTSARAANLRCPSTSRTGFTWSSAQDVQLTEWRGTSASRWITRSERSGQAGSVEGRARKVIDQTNSEEQKHENNQERRRAAL